MNARRPYQRPMAGWWRKNPYFVEYMVHEGTAIFVATYALILLISLIVLTGGESASNSGYNSHLSAANGLVSGRAT